MEIDESMFGHKRKYNRGGVSEGAWAFGIVERGSGRALTFRVPDRTRETLVTRLVQEFIQPGTVILSDKFSPYFNLRMVPTIVTAHMFCASPDTRISYRQCLVIQGYFCTV